MKVSASANGLGTFGEFSIDIQSMQMSHNVLFTSETNNLTEKNSVRGQKWQSRLSRSVFHEPVDVQLARVLNVLNIYYICMGGKNLCYCSTEPQLGHGWERDESLQLSVPREAQLILRSILKK